MKLSELIALIKLRKGMFFSVSLIAFILLLTFTMFFNKVDFEVKATLRLDNNILLSTSEEAKVDKIYNNFSLSLNEFDDISAIEYIQNNKSLNDGSNMISYNQILLKLSSKEFMNSCINSHTFKAYLKEKNIISTLDQINIVEQTDTLSIGVVSKDKIKAEKSYSEIIEIIPQYVNESITNELTSANAALAALISSNRQDVDRLLLEYSALKAETGLSDISSLNSGIEILNSLSMKSSSINSNLEVSNKLSTLLKNDITPELIVKSVDFSGLSLANTLVTYIIIEIIAAFMLGLLSLFVIKRSKKI